MTFTDMDPPRQTGSHGPYRGPHFGRSHRHSEREFGSRDSGSGEFGRDGLGSDRDGSGEYHRYDPDAEGHRHGHRYRHHHHRHGGWSISRTLGRAEAWLDDRGKGAWIAAMVLGFVFVWPVGLAILFYMIWSKRMFSGCSRRSAHTTDRWTNRRHGFRSSGNSAFDSYKAETLRRLEDEQEAFEGFLERLRAAKDKTEFDTFMEDRAARARAENKDADREPPQVFGSDPRVE